FQAEDGIRYFHVTGVQTCAFRSNSSDLEVNIKIALAPLVASGQLDEAARLTLLAGMTDELAELCLRNNYLQSLALSLAQHGGVEIGRASCRERVWISRGGGS